ncbi:hypothetical protein ABXS75_10840 [Roseburia hominis]
MKRQMFDPIKTKIYYLAEQLKPLGIPCLVLALACCGFMLLWPDTDISRKVKKYLPIAIVGCMLVMGCITIGEAIGAGLTF